MRLWKSLAAAAVASLLATSASATVWVLDPTLNANGKEVAASVNIFAVGDLVTIELTNLTADFEASNQAISDLWINFTTDVGAISNFTQDGQLANIDDNGNVTNIAGEPTRWDYFNVAGNSYLNVLGGGQPKHLIASTPIGDVNNGVDNFNPYIMGTGTFTFNLAGAQNYRIAGLSFSFGTAPEFEAAGRCLTQCGGTINPLDPGVVPEPATWALMIMGFGGAGAMLRRRRAMDNLALARIAA